jgi:glycosyltransferase involved in cell wall biosynthesis
MKLSIIIPAYNEEKRLPQTLEEYSSFFSKRFNRDFEIILVPNNCTDRTIPVAEEFQRKFPQIKVHPSKKKGKGNAIIEGFRIARGELMGFVDADNSTKPPQFYELIEKIKDNDGIIASRWMEGARISRKQPLRRRIASRGFNFLVRTFFGISIKDTQCGAKLFKSQAIKKVLPSLGISDWGFDIDLLYHLKKNHFKFIEIPTIWHDSPNSKLKIGKTSFQMLLSIVRLRLIYSPFRFVVKAYDITHDFLTGKNNHPKGL